MSKLLWSAVALAVAAAQPAAAGTTSLYAKVGAAHAVIETESKACLEEARKAPVSRINNGSQYGAAAASGGLIGVATVALISGIQEGVHQSREYQRREATCMREKGFAKLTLTTAEQADYDKQKGDEARNAWIDRFLAGDIAPRVQAELTPAVPPLPSIPAEPFAVGGVKLDPASLAPASGPVPKRGELLTAKAVHRKTAKVAAGFDEKFGLVRMAVEPGATFYAVDYRAASDRDREASSIWCGPTVTKGPFIKAAPVNCFRSDHEGYRILALDDYAGQYAPRKPWMVGPMSQGPGNFVIASGKLALAPSDEDLIGSMEVKLMVAGLGKKDVTLVASASKDGNSVDVWRGTLPWNADGKAVLPFWDHKLTLTHKADAVEVAYTADGDGRGWIDPPKPGPAAPEPAKVAAVTP